MRTREQKMSHELRCASAALAAGAGLLSSNPPNHPTKPNELDYYANGPWAVAVLTPVEVLAFARKQVYYPTNPTPPPGGFPVLTWDNGTNSTSRFDFLKHTAVNTGPGQTIVDAVIPRLGRGFHCRTTAMPTARSSTEPARFSRETANWQYVSSNVP